MGVVKTWIGAGLLAAALLAGPAVAQVPDPYARELAQKLASADIGFSEQGYMRAAGPFATGISRDQARRITLTLRAGQDYLIVGVCDRYCGDPRLSLDDPNQRLVARSIIDAGAAIMHVRPAFTGQHAVRVETPNCAGECWYALNVYSR